MKLVKKLFKIAINDFRLVFRDNSLKVFLFLPLMSLLFIRYAVPFITGIYDGLQNYINVILMLASMQGSTAFGFIYSMVLVDEKDTQVAKGYGILPVSKFWFIAFRLIPPFLLASLATFLLLLVEPFYGFSAFSNLVFSLLAGLIAPLMILFVATIAKNKIEALTWQKLFNLPLFLPVLSFYVPASFSLIFAIFPAFWAYQGLNALINGGNFWIYMSAGFIHTILLIVFLIKRLTRNHFK